MQANRVFQRLTGTFLGMWWCLAFVITHMPVSENLVRTPYLDKITHIILYSGLAFLFLLWKKSPPIYVILTLIVYAIFDEISQKYVHRTPDIFDLLVDVAGIIIGILIFLLLSSYKKADHM